MAQGPKRTYCTRQKQETLARNRIKIVSRKLDVDGVSHPDLDKSSKKTS